MFQHDQIRDEEQQKPKSCVLAALSHSKVVRQSLPMPPINLRKDPEGVPRSEKVQLFGKSAGSNDQIYRV